MMFESAEVRYSVILIARTFGSSLASRRKRSTEVENDSYGCCSSSEPASRMMWKMLRGGCRRGWSIG